MADLSTAYPAQSRNRSVTMPVDHVATFALADLRVASIDPGLFAAASDYAKAFYPRTSLARAA